MPSKKELEDALKKYPWLSTFLGPQAPAPDPVKAAPPAKPTMEVVIPSDGKPYAQPIQGTVVPGPRGHIVVPPPSGVQPQYPSVMEPGKIDAILRQSGAIGPLGGSTRIPRKMGRR
jgi:hypothetical protein